MGLRSLLFHGGYCAAAAQAYFSHSEFLSSREHGHTKLAAAYKALSEQLRSGRDVCLRNLESAAKMAAAVEIELSDCSSDPAAFHQWMRDFVGAVESRFPMNRIDHYYFLFGRKLSEIASNAAAASSLLNVRRHDDTAETAERIEKCLRDCDYSLFKLTAPVALLAGEWRQGFFRTVYDRMNTEFDPFRSASLGDPSDEADSDLAQRLEKYGRARSADFEACKERLDELNA